MRPACLARQIGVYYNSGIPIDLAAGAAHRHVLITLLAAGAVLLARSVTT